MFHLQMSGQEDMVCVHNGIWGSCEKEWNNALCSNVAALKMIMLSEDDYTKSDRRQTSGILLICGIQKHDRHELIYNIEIDSQRKKTNLWLPKRTGGRDKLEVWDYHLYTAIYKIENNQGTIV